MNEYKFSDISIGLSEEFEVSISKNHLDMFRVITGDLNPLHFDDDFAKSKGYKEKVVFGMLTASFMSTLAGVYLPGKYSLIHNVDIQFSKPVYIGDILTVTGTVTEINELFNIMFVKVTITNQNGVNVSKGKMQIGILDD